MIEYARIIEELGSEFGPCIYLPLKYVCRSKGDDVEDLMGDCVLACLRAETQFNPSQSKATFFHAVARNECIKYLRRLRHEDSWPADTDGVLLDLPAPEPEDVEERQEFYDVYESAKLDLTPYQRAVWDEWAEQSMTQPEIAERHGVSKQAIWQLITKARKKLRNFHYRNG